MKQEAIDDIYFEFSKAYDTVPCDIFINSEGNTV